ncbi:hypothetical protein LOD99_3948 [Oopsacas minuta]|uniref:DDE-1 domain-containing protein n=1 Tax=Oopsacas minuta TaxID=111878 RepID=A0AAV7JWA8_9METZ|nr:hypothetical protein LOD99_3933 [Oopsacas minuta]KAI6653112.1 hypothetical protein LOD99_3948 [Oopsacas minuta]
MVWAGISSLGPTPIVFIPTGVKINAQTYQDLVIKHIVKDLSKSMFNNEPFLFKQDMPLLIQQTSLKAGFTTKFLTLFPNRNGPPSSPDLNPLDFSVWSILQTKACCKSHKNLEALKRSIIRAWNEIPQETMRMAVEAVPSQFRAVIKIKGGYIE